MISFDQKTGEASIENERISKDGVEIAVLEGGTKKRLYLRGSEVPIPYELDASLLSLRPQDADLQIMHNLLTDTTTLKARRKQMDFLEREAQRRAARRRSNFPSNYRSTRDKDFEQTRRLHESLTKVVGGFRSLEFIDDGADSKLLVAKLFAEPGKPDYVVRFDELSDGQRALIVLYHLVTTFDLRHRSVFIDEPDNYVSLRELQPWLQLLGRSVEDDSAQAIIVSHSPVVIDYLAADNAWLFERDDGGPASVRPLPVDRDSGLKASEQLARGWIRGA